MEKRQYAKALVQSVDAKAFTITAVASDGTMDRDGEVISMDAWRLDNFLKNPVLLWAHDYSEMPIGKVTAIRTDTGKLVFEAQYAVEHSEKAAQVFGMFKDGFLNAFSVGFAPQKWENGDGTTTPWRTFTEVELLEISAVPVPANPNALVTARGVKSLEPLGIKDPEHFAYRPGLSPEVTEEIATLRAQLEAKNAEVMAANEKAGQLEVQLINSQNELSQIKMGGSPGSGRPGKVGQNDAGTQAILEQRRILQIVARNVSDALSEMKGAGALRSK